MLDRRIGACTKKYAVLGEALKHTWSPYIHNSLFAAAGMDCVYMPITVSRDHLQSAVDVLSDSFCGFNVTIPYKEMILPLLDEVDDAVRACGAVNTVENRDGRLVGHITDGVGMMTAIEEQGISTHETQTLIIGCGGAARVAAYEILKRGGTVCLAARNRERSRKVAFELADIQQDGDARIRTCGLTDIEGTYDLLIQCTPVGMFPSVEACAVDAPVIERCSAVFDAVYNPRKTKLIRIAEEKGKPCVEGLGMLYYQAVEAQKIWFDGQCASKEDQRRIYRDLLMML